MVIGKLKFFLALSESCGMCLYLENTDTLSLNYDECRLHISKTRSFNKSPPKVMTYINTKTELPRYVIPERFEVKKVIKPWLDPHQWKIYSLSWSE